MIERLKRQAMSGDWHPWPHLHKTPLNSIRIAVLHARVQRAQKALEAFGDALTGGRTGK